MLYSDLSKGWSVPDHLPFFSYFAETLAFKHGARAAGLRWTVVLSCAGFFFAPAAFRRHNHNQNQNHSGDGGKGGGGSSSRGPIADSIFDACGEVDGLEDAFVDPTAGLVTVSGKPALRSVLLLFFVKFHKRTEIHTNIPVRNSKRYQPFDCSLFFSSSLVYFSCSSSSSSSSLFVLEVIVCAAIAVMFVRFKAAAKSALAAASRWCVFGSNVVHHAVFFALL
jgi:hypothetical protein